MNVAGLDFFHFSRFFWVLASGTLLDEFSMSDSQGFVYSKIDLVTFLQKPVFDPKSHGIGLWDPLR